MIGYPNSFGVIEPLGDAAAIAHRAGALTFRRATNATDATFTVMVSGDLVQWLAGSSYSGTNIVPVTANTTQISRTPANDVETIVVRDNVSLNSAPQRFMNLRVTDP